MSMKHPIKSFSAFKDPMSVLTTKLTLGSVSPTILSPAMTIYVIVTAFAAVRVGELCLICSRWKLCVGGVFGWSGELH